MVCLLIFTIVTPGSIMYGWLQYTTSDAWISRLLTSLRNKALGSSLALDTLFNVRRIANLPQCRPVHISSRHDADDRHVHRTLAVDGNTCTVKLRKECACSPGDSRSTRASQCDTFQILSFAALKCLA